MSLHSLVGAAEALARSAHAYDDATLANPAFAWGDYNQVRMALLGTIQEIDELAAVLQTQRNEEGRPSSVAQRLCTRHRSAFRDLRALLVGLSAQEFTMPPAPEEWSVQKTLHHIYRAERGFLGSIRMGLATQMEDKAIFDGDRAQAITADAEPAPDEGASLSELLARYQALHHVCAETIVPLSDSDLESRSPFWEPDPPSVAFRIGRLTAHLHEHTVQIEKARSAVAPPHEATRHIRRLYRSLAEVEGACFGAEDLARGCADLAERIRQRTAAMEATVADTERLFTAIQEGDIESVRTLVAANRRLACATNAERVSALLTARYHRQAEIAELLRPHLDELSPFEAAALGEVDELRAYQQWNAKSLNWFSTDGFTPLQLACFFGHEEAVRFLLANGADVHAVSRNQMQIQPIHAAVAGRSPAVVRALIDAGANVNCTQAGGFTPLQAAEENGDEEIAAALRTAGTSDA